MMDMKIDSFGCVADTILLVSYRSTMIRSRRPVIGTLASMRESHRSRCTAFFGSLDTLTYFLLIWKKGVNVVRHLI